MGMVACPPTTPTFWRVWRGGGIRVRPAHPESSSEPQPGRSCAGISWGSFGRKSLRSFVLQGSENFFKKSARNTKQNPWKNPLQNLLKNPPKNPTKIPPENPPKNPPRNPPENPPRIVCVCVCAYACEMGPLCQSGFLIWVLHTVGENLGCSFLQIRPASCAALHVPLSPQTKPTGKNLMVWWRPGIGHGTITETNSKQIKKSLCIAVPLLYVTSTWERSGRLVTEPKIS